MNNMCVIHSFFSPESEICETKCKLMILNLIDAYMRLCRLHGGVLSSAVSSTPTLLTILGRAFGPALPDDLTRRGGVLGRTS